MPITLQIENYKSIGNAKIELRPGLNILVGPNGSGKTCLLSSLNFIRDIFRLGAAQALARQGGALRVYRHGTSEMSFSMRESYGKRTYRRRKIPCQMEWKIRIGQAGEEEIATILHEVFEIWGRFDDKPVRLFSVQIKRENGKRPQIKRFVCKPDDFGRDLLSLWQDQFPEKNRRQLADTFMAKETLSEFQSLRAEPDRSCLPVLAYYDRTIAEMYSLFLYINEYNIAPDVARSSTEQLPFARMLPNGAAVSEVIDALENERYHKLAQAQFMEMEDMYGHFDAHSLRHRSLLFDYRYGFRRRYRSKEPFTGALDNINRELSAAVRPITSVSVDIDPTNGKRFLVFKSDQDEFSPEEVSDGTIKWLCILVSLFVPFSRVYLLEEPENFLHPWMQQRLIAIMREQAKLEKTVFFLSSHSATVLNVAYPDEILVVAHGENGTQISAMSDVEQIKAVLSESDFHLGDLWVSGMIGGVPVDE